MGNTEGTTSEGSGYHGDNYDPEGGGFYNAGYERGYDDAMEGHSTDNPVDYIAPSMSDGPKGYADGVADGGGFTK